MEDLSKLALSREQTNEILGVDYMWDRLSIVVIGASGDLAKKKVSRQLLAARHAGYTSHELSSIKMQTSFIVAVCCLLQTYPSLYDLYSHGYLPEHVTICGYARSAKTEDEIRAQLRPYLTGEPAKIEAFLSKCYYRYGRGAVLR